MHRGFLLIFLLLCFVNGYAQPGVFNNQLLQEKFDLYRKANPSQSLFLHLDKSIYTNNETIWLSAYLFHNNLLSDIAQPHNILVVSLFNSEDRKVWLTKKYTMDKGLGQGGLALPDTIAPGNYQLLAYTNVLDKNGQPVAVFSTPVVIKNTTQQAFNSSIVLLDSVIKNGIIRAKIIVSVHESNPKIHPVINYHVGKGRTFSSVVKEKELIVAIPQEQLTSRQSTLFIRVNYNQQAQYLSVKLPALPKKQLNVRFFPEGGNLSAGLAGRVAWEAKTADDIPISVKGILMKDNNIVDTIETNSYGIGTFQMIPESKSVYTLKVSAGSYLSQDTIFSIPGISRNDVVLNILHAVADDSLAINLLSKQKRPLQILIHNYQGAYTLFQIQLPSLKNQIKLPLNSLPKGLAAVTVMDLEGRPLAERLFFAHYNDSISVALKTDKNIYRKREIIRVKIKLADYSGQSLQGIASAAVIRENRVLSNSQSIEDKVYLNQDLGALPQDPQGEGFRNKEYLENMLLTRGWRRYTWQDLIKNTVQDTVSQFTSPFITGNVTNNGKNVKSPVTIMAVGGTGMGLINTGNDGSFTLKRERLLADDDRQIVLMVSQKNNMGYRIKVNDPFEEITRKLSAQIKIGSAGAVTNRLNSDEQDLKGLAQNINLQTVVIKANKGSNSLYGVKGEPGINACGDYVDEFGYLNYEFSVNKFHPVVGQPYKKGTDLNGSRKFFKVEPAYYHGCEADSNKANVIVQGIYAGKEFYGVQPEANEPQYFSTLYWKAGIVTNSLGEAEFIFTSGDITGKFRLVIQGVTSENVIYKTGVFSVN